MTEPSSSSSSAFRALASVSDLIADPRVQAATSLRGLALTRAIQEAITSERAAIEQGARPNRDGVIERVVTALVGLERPKLTKAINATGVIIHTNLGRSPVSDETAAAMAEAAANVVALEIEPDSNERGGRMREIRDLMRLLTGAEETLVVNNNAAAMLLALSALAAGRSVILSRGEAVEIGGGFRVPDVLRQSGATLVEVGTTNRTYARDYADAIDDSTAALLKVHQSNFRITGFTHETTTAELAEIARSRDLPVIEDLGSGALLETARFGLAAEPTIGERLRYGASVVTASGDKLLGGPQAGLIVGARRWVAAAAAHPLARAVRSDKTCLAGVAATLRHYARNDAETHIPVWRMIATTESDLTARAESILTRLLDASITATTVASVATVGGGSLPGETLPSVAVALAPPSGDDVEGLARRLRVGTPAVFGRIELDRVLLDLRTVLPEDDDTVVQAIRAAWQRNSAQTLI